MAGNEVAILQRIELLNAKDKANLSERYRRKIAQDVKIWYCSRGRSCDGNPHEGVEYQHARGDQWPPLGVKWDTWFYMAGRGAGKTMAGGNWARQMARVAPRIALIGRRGVDVRATMIEGPAGLRAACEAAGESFDWKPALKEFTFENGAKAIGYSAEEPESLRGPEHAAGWLDEPCVAEGELVLLQRGLTPIEQVIVGDMAWTRLGWRRVSATYDNGVKDTYWVHAEGRRVRVTANHRLAVSDGEWLRCDQLSHGSTLVACSHMAPQHGSSGADVATTATARGTIETPADGSSTAMSTKRKLARSQKGTTSTMSTRTRRTMRRRTSRLSPQLSTTPSRNVLSQSGGSMPSKTRTLPSGAHGVGQPWRRSGTSANPALTLASGAARGSSVEPPTPPTAAFPTESVHVGSVSRAGRARVYDLTVEEAHEFVAGGLVVHNCHMDLIEEVWSNYSLGLRGMGVPGGAKTLLTSSPLPVKWTKERIAEKGQLMTDELGQPILDDEDQVQHAPRTVLVSVPTSVNLKNLDEGYKRRVINPLRGTRKGKQELDALLLEDVEGALWESDWLQRKVLRRTDMDRVVVSVDPSGTDSAHSDEAGLVVAGRFGDEYAVFADETERLTPAAWAKRAIQLYEKYDADAIVLERYGGDSATTILRNIEVNGKKFTGKVIQVKARVGKKTRAEPISALYEQKVVWHLQGALLADLEDQMLTWVPAIAKDSPDRIDALVWGLTELSGKAKAAASVGRATGKIRREPQNRTPGSHYRRKNWNR